MSSNWSKELLLLKEDFEEEENSLSLSPIPHENPNNARNESRSTIKALPLSFLRFFSSKKSSSSSFPYLPKVRRRLPLVLSSVVSSEKSLSLSLSLSSKMMMMMTLTQKEKEGTPKKKKKKISFFRGKKKEYTSENWPTTEPTTGTFFFQVIVCGRKKKK